MNGNNHNSRSNSALVVVTYETHWEVSASSPCHPCNRLNNFGSCERGWQLNVRVLKQLGVLTRNEWRILEQMGQGKSYREVERSTGLSKSTIKNNAALIYDKLRFIGAIREGGNAKVLLFRWYQDFRTLRLGPPYPDDALRTAYFAVKEGRRY